MFGKLAIGSSLDLDSCAWTMTDPGNASRQRRTDHEKSVMYESNRCDETHACIGLSAPVATIPRRVISFRTIAILHKQHNCGQ